MAGLVHDLAEWALGDVSSPLKAKLDRYREIEDMWNAAINKQFGVDIEDPEVKLVDSQVLYLECIHVMPGCDPDEVCESRGLTVPQKIEARRWPLRPWNMERSSLEFAARYNILANRI